MVTRWCKIIWTTKLQEKNGNNTYITGLDLLGFKYENRTEPFQGASGATHPVLAEAVTQFQAQAYKELLPADGPVRTQSLVLKIHKQNNSNSCKRFYELFNYGSNERIRIRI